jgi:FKBP-type peptidyl-prolyl cis-trans isomerase SlyD
MKISRNTVVSFTYHLRDSTGEILEQTEKGMPMAYLHGHQNLLPALEEALDGHEVGGSISIELPPEKAYGPLRANAVQRVPIKHLSGHYKRLVPGMVVRVHTEKGDMTVRVLKVGKFNIDVDTNHPFAGKTLVFDIQIESIREASAEEIAHGHAHGQGGHHH